VDYGGKARVRVPSLPLIGPVAWRPAIGASSSSRPVAERSWKNAAAIERKAVVYQRGEAA